MVQRVTLAPGRKPYALIVPMLRVGMPPGTLRVPLSTQDLGPVQPWNAELQVTNTADRDRYRL